jgi:serine/threonine protein kinase
MSGGMSSVSSTTQRTLFRNSNEDREKREVATLRKMDEVTSEYLEKMEENSCFFFGGKSGIGIGIGIGDGNRMNGTSSESNGSEWGDERSNSKNNNCFGIVVPRFEPNEIQLETTIGMGEFGVVMVGTISLSPRSNLQNCLEEHKDANGEETTAECQRPNPSSSDAPALWLSSEQNHIGNVETDRILRDKLAKTCRQRQSHGSTTSTASTSDDKSSLSIELAPIYFNDVPANSLLVIKQIRKDLYPKKRIEAAKALAREAKLLARIQQLYFLEEQSSEQQYPYHHHHNNNNATYRNNHPNLITLRGIVSNPGSPEFGIILDRLHLTLEELANSWGKRQQLILETLTTTRSKNHNLLSLVPLQWWVSPDQLMGSVAQKVGDWFQREDHPEGSKNPAEEPDLAEAEVITTTVSPEALLLLGERILALWDVSEGMGHLHGHKILYRDLKTENVGRTVRSWGGGILGERDHGNSKSSLSRNGDLLEHQRMQIFDFGLAKECKPSDRISRSPKTSAATLETDGGHDNDSEDTGSFYDNYKMTGMTGTMRIMAPEVIRCLPYGLPVDIYSFGICMWEVFTGTKCNFLSAAEICDAKHTVRPELPMVFDTTEQGSVGMPRKLQKLMQNCWHEDPKKRPAFPEISKTLLSILAGMHRQSLRPHRHHHHQPRQQHQKDQHYRYDQYQVTPWRSCVNGNDGGGFWNKIHKPKKRQQQQQQHPTISDSLDATSLSDQAGFWPRLQTIRASGLLDES